MSHSTSPYKSIRQPTEEEFRLINAKYQPFMKRRMRNEVLSLLILIAILTYVTVSAPTESLQLISISTVVGLLIGYFLFYLKRKKDDHLFLSNQQLVRIEGLLDYKLAPKRNFKRQEYFFKIAGETIQVDKDTFNNFEEKSNQEALTRYLRLIEHSISCLDDTLNDLIEYKRMDQSSLKYSIIDFEEMVQDVVKGVRHLDQYATVEMRTKVQQDGQFKNDRGVLRSILLNLVQNAVKYRRYNIDDPFVSVKVEANSKEATIEIKDNGQGMPDVVLQNIFKMFYRGNSDTQGSGLGLYIVKTGMKKIGGTIDVVSEQRLGTTFQLVIPNNQATILRRENVLKERIA